MRIADKLRAFRLKKHTPKAESNTRKRTWIIDLAGETKCNCCGAEAPYIRAGKQYVQMAAPYCYKCGTRMDGGK